MGYVYFVHVVDTTILLCMLHDMIHNDDKNGTIRDFWSNHTQYGMQGVT